MLIFILLPLSLKTINTWVHSIRILVLGLTCLLDRFMYGTWVLVPLNFLKFNFLSSGGDYYGTHKWHWYFTQGFTVMILSYLPFCIAGIIYSKQWKFSGLLAWVLGFYSLLGHKEFRYFNMKIYISMLSCTRSVGFSLICDNDYCEVQVCLASSSHSSDILWLLFSCNRRSWFCKV